MAIIEGTAYWASLTRPNEKFEPMWRIDLAVDAKSAEDLKGQGISIGETTIDEKVIPNIIKFKRKVKKANGEKNSQPQLVDADKKPFDKIVGLDLQAVQVMDLVEYTPKEDFNVESGNTSNGSVDNIKEF
jgi:hypothetical protein